MYKYLRNLLFRLDPEVSHELSLDMIGAAERLHLVKPFAPEVDNDPVEVMGIRFPNAVGLAAGLDKNGDYFNGLGDLGFGFVEIGTVTPLAQPGNPQPRLFRLTEEQAIINRMGFNNKGVEHLVENVKRRRFTGVLGINIGKNKATEEEHALRDYEICMEAVYPYADYITINISSPNTPGLRNLQFGEALNVLLEGIKRKQGELYSKHGKYKPVAVKIAPDMSEEELAQVAATFLHYEIDGVIATNTTLSREGVENSEYKDEAGGLSGRPVREKSTAAIKVLAEHLKGKIPIIGVGGIMTGEDAAEKIKAGASLVQIYSGFIYRGPELVKEAAEAISSAS
ncbi:Dihydroorotate dehydrogenase (quinone) [Thalassocella blandensis]|nr:Dihydroorotate dehydrogenase (quinone) [Thalassocella blandensis]